MCFYAQDAYIGFKVAEKGISQVEEAVSKYRLTETKKKQLYSKLENASLILDKVRDASKNTDCFLSLFDEEKLGNLEQRLISLYGKIHALALDYELRVVASETDSLQKALFEEKKSLAKPKLSHLQKRVTKLHATHALSIDQKEVVSKAMMAIEAAQEKFDGIPSPMRQQAEMKKLTVRSENIQNSAQPVDSTEAVDLEAISDLFEIAALVYKNELQSAELRFFRLPEEQQSLTKKHLVILQNGDETPFMHTLTTVQALIATANDIACNDGPIPYLSREQIEEMFVDIGEISKEE